MVFSPVGNTLLTGVIMYKKYFVELGKDERKMLRQITRTGKQKARKIRWAHALLKADAGWTDEEISESLDISFPTVQRIRQRYVEDGLDVALGAHSHKPRPYAQRFDGKQEAQLIALACSKAPEGRTRWSLRLLTERVVHLGYVESVSHETVRKVLKKRFKTVAG